MSRVLDILGSVPWKINKKVLGLIEEVWARGGGKGTIPIRYSDMSSYVYNFMIKS